MISFETLADKALASHPDADTDLLRLVVGDGDDRELRHRRVLEALAGFALLSASATWFLQLHGALARRRSLALRVSQLEEAGFAESLTQTPRPAAAVIIESIAEQIAVARVDYVQSTETYYFRDLDERASLSSALHAAWRIAEAALASPDAEVRHSGAVLDAALRERKLAFHLGPDGPVITRRLVARS